MAKPVREWISPDGYRLVRNPDHPLANRWGYVPEHRAVLFDAIGDGPHPCNWCGRTLAWRDKRISYKINVDHVDTDRLNNDRANLVPACMECNTRRGVNEPGLKELAAEIAAMDSPAAPEVLLALGQWMDTGSFRRTSLLAFEARGLAAEIGRIWMLRERQD